MRIVSSYRGSEKAWEVQDPEVVFGRTDDRSAAILDLFPDQKVSRVHGRIWEEGGLCWVEDLNSTRGTRLNGVEIKGRGKQQFRMGDLIVVGETTLRLEASKIQPVVKQTMDLEHGTVLLPETGQVESGLSLVGDVRGTLLDAFAAMTRSERAARQKSVVPQVAGGEFLAAVPIEGVGEQTARRLRLVCDLPLQLAGQTHLESLLRLTVDCLVELVPNGDSWGLVLRDSKTDNLLLKAYHAAGVCSVSETLVRRAVNSRKAFIWRRGLEGDIEGTLLAGPITTGMYVPLLWHDEALGALCTDAHRPDVVFTEDDLRLMVVVAQYAAMAVASHQLQERFNCESATKANLLRQFSPAVADHLLAHRGRLRLGGERNEVTLLCSDIRGFTMLAAKMEPDDIMEMLNEYFGYLVPIIFANRGTIDKFMGDAILAVFGSPEPYPAHHKHALKAALEMQAAMAKLNAKRETQRVPVCDIGIGIHCGEVVQGFVGTADRMEFTVIGDAVNRTSRYCAAAPGKEILISPNVHEHVWRIVEAEETTIQTKHEGDLRAYRVRSLKSSQIESGANSAAPE
jgi:adenylate cyclase